MEWRILFFRIDRKITSQIPSLNITDNVITSQTSYLNIKNNVLQFGTENHFAHCKKYVLVNLFLKIRFRISVNRLKTDTYHKYDTQLWDT